MTDRQFCAHGIDEGLPCPFCPRASDVFRLRALLKQAHDRDKFQGECPTIAWYDEVARYFEGKVPNDPALARAADEGQAS